MKRLICILLILIMSVLYFVAFAEDEITFRNIPWGTDLQNAKEMIQQDNIDADAKFTENYLPFGARLVQYTTNNLNTLVPWFPEPKLWVTIWENTGLLISDSKLKVAGYDLESDGIVMYFGNMDGSKYTDNTALYAACYVIDVPDDDFKRTVADLKDKLAGVYGKKFITHKRRDNGYNSTYYIWQGANDSYVVLCDLSGQDMIFDSRNVAIVYASKLWEKKFIDALEAKNAEEEALKEAQKTPEPFGNGNSDGL